MCNTTLEGYSNIYYMCNKNYMCNENTGFEKSAPLHQYFLFCHYWNIYSWEVSPPQIIPMGSSLIDHLLPKNMGVFPNSSKLAGCPNDVICKYYFKEEAVQVGHGICVCTLWKSSMWQYKELHATSWRMPTSSRFCSFFFFKSPAICLSEPLWKGLHRYSIGLITHKVSPQFHHPFLLKYPSLGGTRKVQALLPRPLNLPT